MIFIYSAPLRTEYDQVESFERGGVTKTSHHEEYRRTSAVRHEPTGGNGAGEPRLKQRKLLDQSRGSADFAHRFHLITLCECVSGVCT